ncbi:MAG: amino acid ABC transporter substrate-binding protein [Desulfobacterales bacterium]|nr:amino acid ABC transporter substrate-binding protein [Desulfobacterales bacterium]
MKSKKWSILVFLFLFTLIAGFLCQAPSLAVAKDKDVITVGFGMNLTGRYAPQAVGHMQANELWEEMVNEKGGIYVPEYGKKIPVKLVYYDSKSDPATTVRIYEKLINEDKVDVLFTPQGTGDHFAVAPLAEKYKIPMVGSTAASVKIRDMKTRYFWFTSPLADKFMRALVDLCKDLKVKRVAIIYAQELFPRENLQFLDPYVKEAGLEVVVHKDYPVGERDLTPVLAEIKAKDPDAVLALCYVPGSFTMTTQAQEVGLNPKLFYQLIGPATVVYGPKFGAAAEGIAFMGHWSPKMKWPGAKEVYDRFEAKFKAKPDYLNSALAFIAAQVMQQAIEKVGLDREKLRNYIANNEFQTINGPIRYSGVESSLPGMVLQYQKGDKEIIWPREYATAKPLYPKPAWPKK